MAVSSEDEEDGSFDEFNEDVDMANPRFKIGMIFTSGEVLKRAVKTHAILAALQYSITIVVIC